MTQQNSSIRDELADRYAHAPSKRDIDTTLTEFSERTEGISDGDLSMEMGFGATYIHLIRCGLRPNLNIDQLERFRDFIPSRELLARAKN